MPRVRTGLALVPLLASRAEFMSNSIPAVRTFGPHLRDARDETMLQFNPHWSIPVLHLADYLSNSITTGQSQFFIWLTVSALFFPLE
jgi:hypothetical protein